MSGQDIIYLLGDIVLLSAIPALGLFVGYYYFGSPWKTLLVGRSLMYFAVSLLVIIAIVSLSVWLGSEYFLREWVRLISYGLVSWTTWRLFITLRHIQKKGPVALEEIGLAEPLPVEKKNLFERIREIFTKKDPDKVHPPQYKRTDTDEIPIK